MNSTRSEENLQSCKIVESSSRRDEDDDLKNRDNSKVGSDSGLELQIWTGSVKAGRPIRKMFARKLLNWPSVCRTTEISAAESFGAGFVVKGCRRSKLHCPPEAQLLAALLEFEAKKLNK